MDEAKLKLSHQYWTTSSSAEKISIFQRFINIDNSIVKDRDQEYTRFDIISESIAVQIIFLDSIEKAPKLLDSHILKLIFVQNETSQNIIDLIKQDTNTCVFLFEEDIEYIIKGLKIEELSLYKVFYHFIKGNNLESKNYDQDDVHRFWHNSHDRNIHLEDFEFERVIKKLSLDNHPRNNVKHYKTNQIVAKVKERGISNIILDGKSASGKTTFILTVADELSLAFRVYYIESTILNDEVIAGLAIDLIRNLNNCSEPLLLITDDLQSNLDGARKLIQFLNFLQVGFGGKKDISFIGIIWEEFTKQIQYQFNVTPKVISISASDLTANLIDGRCTRILTKSERQKLVTFSDENLFILSLAITFLNNSHESIDQILSEIPKLVVNNLISKVGSTFSEIELKRLFFCLSLFGRYDIDLTESFLVTVGNDKKIIEYLFSKNIIRKRGNGITLGHKSYNRIIYEHLQTYYTILKWYEKQKGLITNSDFILEFLKGLQPNEIYSILKKLYENSNSIVTSTIITNTWLSIDKILGKIIYHQKIDPSWNNNASSALFAIQTLNNFGFGHEAEKSIDFFRHIYRLDNNGNININLEHLITVDDFKNIKINIIRQDEFENIAGERGSDLDEVEFHKNWLSGIILSAEGFHNTLSVTDLEMLSVSVERNAIGGRYFYPQRVSWCTSRVLIGLGLCNRNIHNSKVVGGVAEWLLDHPNYDNSTGYWESGTGVWNHKFEATALAISGLIGVGIPTSHPKIQRGIENLISQKNLFVIGDMELDGIFAIQTLSKADINLFEVQHEIKLLSEWMTTKADWESIKKTSADTFKQSCQISQSAAGIIEVMWKMVRDDLPTVVKAIDKIENNHKNINIFVSYEWASQSFAIQLVEELATRYGKDNILFDLKDNNNISSTQFMEKINDVDIVIYLCTKKYKQKADKRIGGVGHEAEQISKGLSERKDKFIPILLEGEWKIESMPNIWLNTIGVSCLDEILTDRVKLELYKLIETKYKNNNPK